MPDDIRSAGFTELKVNSPVAYIERAFHTWRPDKDWMAVNDEGTIAFAIANGIDVYFGRPRG